MKVIRLLTPFVLAAPLAAQSPGSAELIPRELVDGLLGARGTIRPVIYVGEMPREMTGRVYVPKGARVLGGVSTGSSGTVVMLSSARRETIAAELETELPKLGWKQFDRSSGFSSSEFRDAPLPPGGMRIATTGAQMFCGPSGGMTVNLEAVGFADTRITVMANDINMCSQGSGPDTRREEYNGRPTLYNPVGARTDMTGTCFRGINDGFSGWAGGAAMLSTTMTPQALLDHYSKQLADSGWTAVNSVKVTRVWQKTDTAGKRIQYTLNIEAPASNPTCRRLESQFARSTGR